MRDVVLANHDTWHAEIRYLVEEAGRAQADLVFRRIRLDDAEKAPFAGPVVATGAAIQAAAALRAARAGAADAAARLAADDALVVLMDGNLQGPEDDEYFFVAEDEVRVAVASTFHLAPDSAFMGKDGWWSRLGRAEQERLASGSVVLTLFGAVTAMLTGRNPHDETRSCVLDYCQRPRDTLEALRGGITFCAECQDALRPTTEGRALLRIAERLRASPPRATALAATGYDVLLAHRDEDRARVQEVAASLGERGVRTWPDVAQLGAAAPAPAWDPASVERAGAVAAFVGASGAGPWTELPVASVVRAAVERGRPVVVVVLPDAPDPSLPPELEGRTVIDFRSPDDDPASQLVWVLTGGATVPPPPPPPPPPDRITRILGRYVAPVLAAAALAVALQQLPGGCPGRRPKSAPEIGQPQPPPQPSAVAATVEAFRARRDRALLVATNVYRGRGWKRLTYPIDEAERLRTALRARGFEAPPVLRNPSYDEFLDALTSTTKGTWGDYDQLVVFVSGHGQLAKGWGTGRFVVNDSEGRGANYVEFPVLRELLDHHPSKHLLLVVDTCYAGTFDPRVAEGMTALALKGDPTLVPEPVAARKLAHVTRRFLGAAGNEVTFDPSIFASTLAGYLEGDGGDGYLTDLSIAASVQALEPSPVYWSWGSDSSAGAIVVPPRRGP